MLSAVGATGFTSRILLAQAAFSLPARLHARRHMQTRTMRSRFPASPILGWLIAVTLAALAGCASDERARDAAPSPAEIRARIAGLIPAGTPDRAGWAADIQSSMAALEIAPNSANICAVLAVTEQESGFRADPAVPGLSRIAWEEIERRAERIGVPMLAVRLALQIDSPTGKRYGERLDAVKTEKELSRIFEDFIGMVPMGERLFAGLNPVRTGGPMQVSIAFAERHAAASGYPFKSDGSVRHEVFTRRGGMYFGIAHLLAYPANYDAHLYRFADFNAGHYASRNAAFQNAVSVATGIALDLDGDLIRHGSGSDAPGSTELAVRALARQIDMDHGAIRNALEQGDGAAFERGKLYRRVFELAERIEHKALPRAVLPRIDLHSPKITRKLTTEWFAKRVDERHRRCIGRAGASTADNT